MNVLDSLFKSRSGAWNSIPQKPVEYGLAYGCGVTGNEETVDSVRGLTAQVVSVFDLFAWGSISVEGMEGGWLLFLFLFSFSLFCRRNSSGLFNLNRVNIY